VSFSVNVDIDKIIINEVIEILIRK